MLNEDDDRADGGPLPDPSNRHWRHPSEVAGPGSMSVTDDQPATSGLGPLATFGVLALGGTATALFLFGFTGISLTSWNTGTSVALPNQPAAGAVDVSAIDQAAADLGAAAEAIVSSGSDQPDDTDSTLTIAPNGPGPGSSDPGDLRPLIRQPGQESEPEAVSPSDDHVQTALETTGVFSSRRLGERLASFLIHDQLVLTSASALDGRSSVWLAMDDEWVSAPVVGVDPYTDVAVLEPIEWFEELAAASVSIGRAEPSDMVAVDPLLGRLSGPAPSSWSGVIGRVGHTATNGAGHTWYEAMLMSMPTGRLLAGSAVLNEAGEAVGMVINNQASLASAVPVDLAVTIGRSLIANGRASEAWIGVEVATDGNGVTRLVSVDPSSPAVEQLEPGDVVVAVDGQPVRNADHLVFAIRRAGPGTELRLFILRNGEYLPVTIITGTIAG